MFYLFNTNRQAIRSLQSGMLAFIFLFFTSVLFAQTTNPTLTGELKKWHKIMLSFDGPMASETGSPNPFTDYRLNVTFTNGSNTFIVPGYFAADGNAGETSATSGKVWRVLFAPNATGTWHYTVSFKSGRNIAASIFNTDGKAVAPLDGKTGTFVVEATDKTAPDLRAKGRLNYVGEHYYQFAETGAYFVKGGADSPENLLAYQDFDGTTDEGGRVENFLHTYKPHVKDWKAGDPTWKNGKGKGLIGAINYIADVGLNSIYFLTQNVDGDGDDTWTWIASDEVLRYDCSKLDQWEIVMEYMDHKGLFINLVHQEQENDQYLDEGNLGTARKIYYRELIARFGHHLALQWNMGEECTNTIEQVRDYCKFIRALDPYDHPIVLHTYAKEADYETYYGGLLGNPNFDGVSFQINFKDNLKVHDKLVDWLDRSAKAGRKWNVMFDEVHPADTGLAPDADDPGHHSRRKYDLWAVYLAGSGGTEWYMGSESNLPEAEKATANLDRTLENFRTREEMWRQTSIAREFMEKYMPLPSVKNYNNLVSNGICLAAKGDTYLVYLPNGGTTQLNLETFEETYTVQWFDPRNGGALQYGNVVQISGKGEQSLGNPPDSITSDWAILVTNTNSNSTADTTAVLNENTPNSCAVFEEKDGLVVMEAENTPSDLNQWIVKKDVAGYTGTGHLEYTGGRPNGLSGPASSPLKYTFKINKAGDYRMMIRARKRLEGAPSDRANDGFVRMIGDFGEGPNPGNQHNDDGLLADLQRDTKMSGGDADTWAWAEQLSFGGQDKRYTTYHFKAGETYTLVVSGRSGRWNIDRIVLYHLEDVGVAKAKDPKYVQANCVQEKKATYQVAVANGFGTGTFLEGENVQIEADPAPSGQVFDRWVGDTSFLKDATMVSPIFKMPAQNIRFRATYVKR